MFAMSVLAALLTPAGAGAQTQDCYALWPKPDPILYPSYEPWGAWELGDGSSSTYTPCELFLPASGNLTSEFGVEIKIYIPEGWRELPHSEAPPNTPQIIADGIRDAMAALRPEFEPIPVYAVLLYNVAEDPETREWERDVLADTGWVRPCPIAIYITSVIDPNTADDIKLTVAHEIYHCYQYEYFNAQMWGAASDDIDEWWVEGTAEYFAQTLFPCAQEAAGLAASYDMKHPTYAPADPYANFVFFMHLADHHGFDLEELGAFSRGMPTTGGQAGQRSAISGYSDIEEKFHSFAEKFLDKDISHCVGENLSVKDIPKTTLPDSKRILLEADPFTIWPRIVTLDKDKRYRVRLDTDKYPGNPPGAVSFRLADDKTPWTKILDAAVIGSACHDEARYMFVTTTVNPDQQTFEADLVFVEEDTFSTEIGCECPQGVWDLDVGDLNGKLGALGNYSGSMRLWLQADGGAKVVYDDFNTYLNGVLIRHDGTSSGAWVRPGLVRVPVGTDPDYPETTRAAEKLGIETTADVPQPDFVIRFDWTTPGVTRVTPPNPRLFDPSLPDKVKAAMVELWISGSVIRLMCPFRTVASHICNGFDLNFKE